MTPQNEKNDSLKVCLLSYRGNPNSGGQGVYIRYLARALTEFGHEVTVISSPPYPRLTEGVALQKIENLDLYNAEHLFKPDNYRKLFNPTNFMEYILMTSAAFPEPLTFGMRVAKMFRQTRPHYDVVHDNQCLSYGVADIARYGYPTVATIHHPITVDYKLELESAKSIMQSFKIRRWYSFIKMQKKVARQLAKIITVSESSKKDISREFVVPSDKFRVVLNGINTDFFYPQDDAQREEEHLIVTTSADTPLKGLSFLLEAVAILIPKHNKLKLTVIGEPKENGTVKRFVEKFNLEKRVIFTGRINSEDFAHYYARASVAVVPSLYEGFGMPAGEAMACGIPVVSTAGGALPEVVGSAGILVPPANATELAKAIAYLLDNPNQRKMFAQKGIERVNGALTWKHAAQKTVAVYREVIDAHN